jgi:hypothetical protein
MSYKKPTTKMSKIVFNACYGGFGLSKEATKRYSDIKGLGLVFKEFSNLHHEGSWSYPNGDFFDEDTIYRNDMALVRVVEELGKAANAMCAELSIMEVPAGSLYRIDEYDGREDIILADEQTWYVA